MLSFTGIPGAARIEERMERNPVTRFLTSHVWLAFCYGIFLFLYDIALLRQAVPALHPVLIAWAGALFLYDVLVRQLWRKLPYWPWLLAFTLATGLTVLTNLEIGIVTGVKCAVMMVLPLVAFYPVCLMEKKEDRKKALLVAMLGAAVLVFLASLAALVMYLIRYSQVLSFMGVTKITGYRYYIVGQPDSGVVLFGFYEDTNHAAAFAAAFTAYSLVLYRECCRGIFSKSWQNALGKVFAVANAAVQIIYFPLANSRGGWVCLAVALVLVLGLWLYNAALTGGAAGRGLKALALALVCTAVLYCTLVGFRTVSSELSTAVSTAIQNFQAATPADPGNTPAQKPGAGSTGTGKPNGGNTGNTGNTGSSQTTTPAAPDSFQKTDNMMGSGRLIIWKDSLELFMKKPILGNMNQHQYYAQKYDVARNSLIRGVAVHNSYLDMLVTGGVLGFVPMMAFWLLCFLAVLKKMFRDRKAVEWQYYAITFCVLLTAGTSFFLSAIFVSTTATYYLMLVPTGYLVAEALER